MPDVEAIWGRRGDTTADYLTFIPLQVRPVQQDFWLLPSERSPADGKQGQCMKFSGNDKEMVISGLLVKCHPSLSSQVFRLGLGTLLCPLALRNFPTALYYFRLSWQNSPGSFPIYLSHYTNFSCSGRARNHVCFVLTDAPPGRSTGRPQSRRKPVAQR